MNASGYILDAAEWVAEYASTLGANLATPHARLATIMLIHRQNPQFAQDLWIGLTEDEFEATMRCAQIIMEIGL